MSIFSWRVTVRTVNDGPLPPTQIETMNINSTDNLSAEDGGAIVNRAVSRGPFKVEWQEWHEQCADGCCDRYGIEVFVDGGSIGSKEFGDTGDAIEMLMEHLGHSVEVRRLFSDHG